MEFVWKWLMFWVGLVDVLQTRGVSGTRLNSAALHSAQSDISRPVRTSRQICVRSLNLNTPTPCHPVSCLLRISSVLKHFMFYYLVVTLERPKRDWTAGLVVNIISITACMGCRLMVRWSKMWICHSKLVICSFFLNIIFSSWRLDQFQRLYIAMSFLTSAPAVYAI